MFQKTAIFINNAVKTSHHTNDMFSSLSLDFCSLMIRTEMVLKMLPFSDLMWLLAQEHFIVFRNYFNMLHSTLLVVLFVSQQAWIKIFISIMMTI